MASYLGGKLHSEGSWRGYGQMIAMLRIFDNYHSIIKHGDHDDEYLYPYSGKNSVSAHYYNKNPNAKQNRENIKKYLAGLSYKHIAYSNQMAKLTDNKKSFEFVVKNNVD